MLVATARSLICPPRGVIHLSFLRSSLTSASLRCIHGESHPSLLPCEFCGHKATVVCPTFPSPFFLSCRKLQPYLFGPQSSCGCVVLSTLNMFFPITSFPRQWGLKTVLGWSQTSHTHKKAACGKFLKTQTYICIIHIHPWLCVCVVDWMISEKKVIMTPRIACTESI